MKTTDEEPCSDERTLPVRNLRLVPQEAGPMQPLAEPPVPPPGKEPPPRGRLPPVPKPPPSTENPQPRPPPEPE